MILCNVFDIKFPEIDENENRVEGKDSWLKKRMFC